MLSNNRLASLSTVPQEILERIAFYAATDSFLGPPSGIVPLLCLNRRLNSILSIKYNPTFYSYVFVHKFDLDAPTRRIGAGNQIPASALAEELQRRCVALKRIKNRLDSRADSSERETLGNVLWTAYLMVLESDGKNERQLCEYALIRDWLKEYLFRPAGKSRGIKTIKGEDKWLEITEPLSLSLWLFWFVLKPDDYTGDEKLFRDATEILKIIALGAHKYPVCHPSWVDYTPKDRNKPPSLIRHFSTDLRVDIPAPSSPAILAYLTLVNKLKISWEVSATASHQQTSSFSPIDGNRHSRKSTEWGCDWARLFSLSIPKSLVDRTLTGAFAPGSLEGVWEGIFTYTEFTSYAALLNHAPPSILQRSLVAQHRQTIRIREWHLLDSDFDVHSSDLASSTPLGPGNPSRGYVPNGVGITEIPGALSITEPGRAKPVVYRSWASMSSDETRSRKVKDVFLTGEGHSAWGQFSLIGRVRPRDGFIALSKEYVAGDRGRWLYRAYMVGNTYGSLSGRWRDTLSPVHLPGYEGTWVASRRR